MVCEPNAFGTCLDRVPLLGVGLWKRTEGLATAASLHSNFSQSLLTQSSAIVRSALGGTHCFMVCRPNSFVS